MDIENSEEKPRYWGSFFSNSKNNKLDMFCNVGKKDDFLDRLFCLNIETVALTAVNK